MKTTWQKTVAAALMAVTLLAGVGCGGGVPDAEPGTADTSPAEVRVTAPAEYAAMDVERGDAEDVAVFKWYDEEGTLLKQAEMPTEPMNDVQFLQFRKTVLETEAFAKEHGKALPGGVETEDFTHSYEQGNI